MRFRSASFSTLLFAVLGSERAVHDPGLIQLRRPSRGAAVQGIAGAQCGDVIISPGVHAGQEAEGSGGSHMSLSPQARATATSSVSLRPPSSRQCWEQRKRLPQAESQDGGSGEVSFPEKKLRVWKIIQDVIQVLLQISEKKHTPLFLLPVLGFKGWVTLPAFVLATKESGKTSIRSSQPAFQTHVGYWHKGCFHCEVCKMALNMNNYKGYEKKPYCNACNLIHAKQVAEKLEASLDRKGDTLVFMEEKALGQHNSHDCSDLCDDYETYVITVGLM
ncbi:LIM and SH3 domain protein 1 [Fukomys damarensis]|uniref:LIM and SH3 domain protein 1 n=1 Tax=Fukomys damarensis TaxID=885580 RepID=A0A091EI11_FUKDA|nr:LIM and SH3 domain protein 1 [Fukomys damarensis]